MMAGVITPACTGLFWSPVEPGCPHTALQQLQSVKRPKVKSVDMIVRPELCSSRCACIEWVYVYLAAALADLPMA